MEQLLALAMRSLVVSHDMYSLLASLEYRRSRQEKQTMATEDDTSNGGAASSSGRPVDYATMEECGEKYGDLQAMDMVRIVGLTSDRGRELNGRVGTIESIDKGGKLDGTANPYVALREDGRYKVKVEFEETVGREVRPGSTSSTPETRTYLLKRENLEMHSVGFGTLARSAEGRAALGKAGLSRVETTAEHDAREPETAGWFPAILQGDTERTREILEYVRGRYATTDAAEFNLDANGDSALMGAIQSDHVDIVRILPEFGADPNKTCQVPMMRRFNLTYLSMAIMLAEKGDNGEESVNALLDSGRADVNVSSPHKGTPLGIASRIETDHNLRMRLCRKLLELGADPNQVIDAGMPGMPGRNETTVLIGTVAMPSGKYSEEHRLELMRLLLDNGADPGKVVHMDRGGEACTILHIAVSRREVEIVRCLLSYEKGRAAVNVRRRDRDATLNGTPGDGETALAMCLAGPQTLSSYKEARDIAVQLLQAGADPSITDNVGISAEMWMNDPVDKNRALKKLWKKSLGKDPAKFWDASSGIIRSFIDDGKDEGVQCADCRTWLDDTEQERFSHCSKCKKVHCKCILNCC